MRHISSLVKHNSNLVKQQKQFVRLHQVTSYLLQSKTFVYKQEQNSKYQQQQQKKELNSQIYFRFSSTQDQNQVSQKEISDHLQKIGLDILGGKDMISTNHVVKMHVTEQGKVEIYLKLDENYRKLKQLISKELYNISWVTEVSVQIAKKEDELKTEFVGGLENVKKIIAVSSCKGGVGKSTISINLACTLQKQGYKVGIFDADIYGPSLPTLIKKEGERLHSPQYDKSQILPVEYEGLKAMSYGFANGEKALIRGPQVSGIVKQLIQRTQWGELDYLIVDFPPGTGDIQLTLCQNVDFNGAVIVTTPQKISFIDVVKGIQMFDELKVPTLAVVENMSEYVCDKCNKVHKFFGDGYLERLKKQFGINKSIGLPMFNYLALCSDAGQPAVHVLPEQHTITKLFRQLSDNLIEELKNIEHQKQYEVLSFYDSQDQLLLIKEGNQTIKKISAFELRSSCQCALCVDEFTGKKILKKEDVEEDVQALEIKKTGNYAVQITWSDGHNTSIYPYATMLSDQIDSFEEEQI